MNEDKYIIPDSELLELSESVPLTEGGTLEDFLTEAQQVAGAIEHTGADISILDNRARALFFMRCFYFLGVLRGGEAYRAALLDELPGAIEPACVPFALLSPSCTDIFLKDLQGEPAETVRAIYEVVGLTNPDSLD